jgi:hypothetical protein
LDGDGIARRGLLYACSVESGEDCGGKPC